MRARRDLPQRTGRAMHLPFIPNDHFLVADIRESMALKEAKVLLEAGVVSHRTAY
jgi:hypothetical protein